MKRTPIRSRSKKKQAEHRLYLQFVAELEAESPWCEVGPFISTVNLAYRGCTRRMQGLHHLRKRSAGGAEMDRANVLRSCNTCNGWVEDHPEQARRANLVIRG